MSEPLYEMKREWMETYLDVCWEEYPELAFEAEMIERNQPEGIVGFTGFYEGAEYHYKYKVSGKKPLSAVFRALPMKEWHLRKILSGLIAILERGEEHLLCGDSFLLKGDTVFVDVTTYEPQVIYLPGYKNDLNNQMGQLMEFMLNRLDYDDKPAVNLLYDCFAGSQMENGGIKDIKERLEKVIPGISGENTPAMEAAEAEKTEQDESEGMTLHGIFAKIKALFIKPQTGFLEETEEEDTPSGDTVFLKKDAYAYERRDDERTVFLPGKIVGSTPWLVDIKTAEVIKIHKTPFSLGSLPEYNDYCMNDPRISRLHAAITENSGRYCIMDLNSTNGTYINDSEVLPGHDEELFNNDKLRLADREFIYKAGDVSESDERV